MVRGQENRRPNAETRSGGRVGHHGTEAEWKPWKWMSSLVRTEEKTRRLRSDPWKIERAGRVNREEEESWGVA